MNKNLHSRFNKASQVLSAVNNRMRLQILDLIQSNQIINATQIATDMSLEYEEVKKHMLILMRAGIISINREDTHSFYEINSEKMFKLKAIVSELASPVYKHGQRVG